jgi:hypothetical protein
MMVHVPFEDPTPPVMTLARAKELRHDVFFLPSLAAAEAFAASRDRDAVAFADVLSHFAVFCVAVVPRPKPVVGTVTS